MEAPADEVRELCVRVLGSGAQAQTAARRARPARAVDRLELLAAATAACRELAQEDPAPDTTGAPATEAALPLAQAVARELEQATRRLPERQREVLALREALGLGHAEIARVIGLEPSAVAPLLARARLRLRGERRGQAADSGERCEERDRVLRLLACRQDREVIEPGEEDWLHEHLMGCEACRRDHAAMLEASVCYRAWRLEPDGPAADAAP